MTTQASLNTHQPLCLIFRTGMEPAHRCKPDTACRKGLIPGEGISVSLERPDRFLRSIAGRGRTGFQLVMCCSATGQKSVCVCGLRPAIDCTDKKEEDKRVC